MKAHTYHGTPSKWITVLDGIKSTLKAIAPHVTVTYVNYTNYTSSVVVQLFRSSFYFKRCALESTLNCFTNEMIIRCY